MGEEGFRITSKTARRRDPNDCGLDPVSFTRKRQPRTIHHAISVFFSFSSSFHALAIPVGTRGQALS